MKLHNPTSEVLRQVYGEKEVIIQPGKESISLTKLEAEAFMKVFPMVTVVSGTENEIVDSPKTTKKKTKTVVAVDNDDEDEDGLEEDPDYQDLDELQEVPEVTKPAVNVKVRSSKS